MATSVIPGSRCRRRIEGSAVIPRVIPSSCRRQRIEGRFPAPRYGCGACPERAKRVEGQPTRRDNCGPLLGV